MNSRLSSIAPQLEVSLARAAAAQSNKAALAAALLAAETCKLAEVAPWIDTFPDNLSLLDALIERLDDEYFTAHEQFENGAMSESAYIVPFFRARAASALAFALRGNPLDAVYEAVMSTDDPTFVLRVVEHELATEA